MRPIPTMKMSHGATVPTLGLGTWRMGEEAREADREVRALELGVDLGMTLIDTAEMYGEGGAEEIVARAIQGKRDRIFLVSKVYPYNASRKGAIAACERSLARLKTDRLDLYLLHWRGSYPLSETVAAFEQLKAQGKIAAWGVSNFDVSDMAELAAVDSSGACVCNQVLYHIGERGIEYELLPQMSRRGIMTMAYSPLGQGHVLGNRTLREIAAKHDVTPAAIALVFLLRQPGVAAIQKAVPPDNVRHNRAAAGLVLDTEDLRAIDQAFPPPRRKTPLSMI